MATCDSQARSVFSRWYALRLRSRFDFVVRDALRDAAIEEFIPTYTDAVRWSDREATTVRPLFAGYAFARFDPADRAAILAIRGVLQILSMDSRPIPIPDYVIADLRRVVATPACQPCKFAPGAAITVARGPFAGVTGIVSRVKNETILTVPVQIFGRAVAVSIDALDVAPAVAA